MKLLATLSIGTSCGIHCMPMFHNPARTINDRAMKFRLVHYPGSPGNERDLHLFRPLAGFVQTVLLKHGPEIARVLPGASSAVTLFHASPNQINAV